MGKNWFEVDKNGLKQMLADFPEERMVAELVQNCWDTDANLCSVNISHNGNTTILTVEDDNPDGFNDLRDAYTLFKHTDKRTDPTKRGRFNLGEKLVLSRAIKGTIETTNGCVRFDAAGRHTSKKRREYGSKITIVFKKWAKKTEKRVLDFLYKLYVPNGIKFSVNGAHVAYVKPLKSTSAKLSTEVLKERDGQFMMTRTLRKTQLWFYHKRFETAYLFELGLPVCPIDGRFDVNVQQKIPQSQDRTLVPHAYLQDIYAETIIALGDMLEAGDLSDAHIRMALEDDRVTADVAAKLFKMQFGDNAVIQTLDADANQEAARAGATIISSRTFGSSINSKFREGGIKTTTEKYSRDENVLVSSSNLPSGYKEVELTPNRLRLINYTKTLCQLFYNKDINVKFAKWHGSTAMAIYQHGIGITFNIIHMPDSMISQPVSKCTAICIHELAHCMGTGHDGVYDNEFENLVNKHTALLAKQPELYKQYEPQLFKT